MVFLKKQWQMVLVTISFIVFVIVLIITQGQINDLQEQNKKLSSTLDSVESVVLSTDSSISEMSKKVDSIGANVSYIIQKVRRR
ncbi:MAG: hypothetical protein GY874_07845 [Desulfobacteraceae bacterium]|nr:hypothetical protein [Desulfobacteraceae bacterium]